MHTPLYPALPRQPHPAADLDRLGVEIVLCDADGRPMRRRILTLASCLGLAPRAALPCQPGSPA